MLLPSAAARAEEGSVNRARIMWSAFQCATYAEMAGDKKEQERLFEVGANTGKSLLDDVLGKNVPREEFKNATQEGIVAV